MVVYIVMYRAPSDSQHDNIRILSVFKEEKKDEAKEFAKTEGQKMVRGDAEWHERDWIFGVKYSDGEYGEGVEVITMAVR